MRGPGVVLLHSSLSSRQQWKRLAGELERAYDVLCGRPARYGDAPPVANPEAYSLREETAHVLALADERFGHGARFHLVGHSYGGLAALALAREHPGRSRASQPTSRCASTWALPATRTSPCCDRWPPPWRCTRAPGACSRRRACSSTTGTGPTRSGSAARGAGATGAGHRQGAAGFPGRVPGAAHCARLCQHHRAHAADGRHAEPRLTRSLLKTLAHAIPHAGACLGRGRPYGAARRSRSSST